MRLDREELRTLFLFEALTDEQLDRLAERGELRTYDAGAIVVREGQRATHLFVLLEGALRLSRTVNGEELVIVETGHRGSYGGAVRAYVDPDEHYGASITATAPSRFYRLPGEDFAALMKDFFPMAVHLLDGLFVGIRNSEGQVRQREHLASLGRLSAELAHELNNPASASVRATSQLRERVSGMRDALAVLASGTVAPAVLNRLVAAQADAVDRATRARRDLTPLQTADLEDDVTDRLDELGVRAAYELAPVLAAAGLGVEWVDAVTDELPDDARAPVLRWLADAVEAEALMEEIEDASTRISGLVAAVKEYSHMDQASVQDVDLRRGLDSTVVMLGSKLSGTTVEKDYDPALPLVPAWPAELNQVWTNLLDNAAHAVDGRGTIVLRTRREGDQAVVEVVDDGPGIAPEVLPRIWDAFFTTKPPGEGSGLGLDSARRIVEGRHHGTIEAVTGADGTTFRVRLPLRAPG